MHSHLYLHLISSLFNAIVQADPPKPSLLATLIRHYDDLVDHVRRRFGERVFAREVVHDLCVQLLEDDEREGVRQPLALLRKIAHDNAVSHCRRERRRGNVIITLAELPEVACSAAPQERQVDAATTLDKLVAAISRLPPRCQAVFIMHKLHQIPQAEVAERLGISLKTVEKHLRLGMIACREYLQSEGAP